MLTVSSKTRYGLLAVYELARYYQAGPLQIRVIADLYGISQNYLEQVLVLLA